MPENVLGLNFALPQNRYIPQPGLAQAPEQGAVPFFALPKQGEDIAFVEGVTDRYIDTRSEIEAWALSMSKEYGVDVTQPDPLQPGGGIPFKTFQNLATKLLVTANDLKRIREQQNQEAPYRMSGAIQDVEGFDPTGQLTNRIPQNERFFSTKLLPEVEQANEILKTQVHTDADYNRAKTQVIDPLVTRLTEAMSDPNISPAEKQRLQFNLNALVQQPKTTPYAFFQEYGRGNKKTVELDLLKKVTNLAQAKWAPGSYLPDTDENGNPILVNKAFDGEQAGEHSYEDAKGLPKRIPRIIDGWIKKSDGVSYTFKQQDGVEIPPVKVSSKAGDEVTASIIASNPKYGSVTKMYEAMREQGWGDESNSLINDKVLAGKEFDTPDPKSFGAGIEIEKARIVEELKKKRKSPGRFSRESMTFELPDQTSLTFYPNRIGGGWYADGEPGLGENLSEADVIKILGKFKYFNQFLSQTPGVTPEQEVANTLGSESPEVKKARELIEKYKKK